MNLHRTRNRENTVMKIRTGITLNIDAAAWASEYGVDPADVRADVQNHLRSELSDVRETLRSLGLLLDD